MKKYKFIRTIPQAPEEFVSLHDVQFTRILMRNNTVKFLCKNGFYSIRNNESFHINNGIVLLKGALPREYTCHIYYGKASPSGEIRIGLPVTLREIDDYLKKNNATIELYKEFYSETGLLLTGNLISTNDMLGDIQWRHITIEIMEVPTIEYMGEID